MEPPAVTRRPEGGDGEPVEGELVERAAERAAEIVVAYHEVTTGPIPAPTVLAGYEELVPGAADRIVAMAEREQAHRHTLQTSVITHEATLAKRGQVCGVVVAVLGLLVALGLGLAGQATAGTIIAAIDLVGLVGVFLTRSWLDRPVRPSGGGPAEHPQRRSDQPAQPAPTNRSERRAAARAQRRR